MKWHWKVRIYAEDGYGIAQVETERDLKCIDLIQDFYLTLTGHKMLIEGMSEQKYGGIAELNEVFNVLWQTKTKR